MFGWHSLDEADKRRLVDAIADRSSAPEPHHVVLDLTDGGDTVAQLNRQGPVPSPDAPPLSRIRALLDELAEAGVRSVRLGGTGEPLLHPDLAAVLDALGERGLELDEVVTTGIPATDLVVARLVDLPCRTVRVLATAARPTDFMRVTGIDQLHFYRLLDSVRRILDRRGGRDRPHLALHFVVHRENVRDLSRMYHLGRELDVDEIVVGPDYELGPELELEGLALRPEHADELAPPLANLLELDRDRRLLRLCFPWPNHDELVAAVEERAPGTVTPSAPSFDERDTGHCLLGWLSLTVDADGAVHPCPLLQRASSDRALARLDGGSVADLWRSEPVEELRAEMRDAFLARGRLFHRSGRFRRLAPRCVAPRACSLKHRYREDDELFHAQLSRALEPSRRRLSLASLRRRAEETVYRVYHGAATRWVWFRSSDTTGAGGISESGRAPSDSLAAVDLAPDNDATMDQSTAVPSLESPRLHIGSGMQRLEGWINIDIENLPGVDLVLDVRDGLPFEGVEAIFAEHFIEHLTLSEALDFLAEAHRVLGRKRWLRLSTPSLEWVWTNVFDPRAEREEQLNGALRLNRAFHGWGHRFLWSRPLLEAVLGAVGFEELSWCRYGESELDVFRALERHERYADTPELPHVHIVEARKGERDPAALGTMRERLRQEFLEYVEDDVSRDVQSPKSARR